MTIRKTDPVERVDMMIAQAERFARLDLLGEATARAKQVLAYCDRETRRDPQLGGPLAMRKMMAEAMLRRLGRSERELKVDADDAANPDAWA